MDFYEIRIKGHIPNRRLTLFSDLTATHLPTGETVLTGPIVDQAALFGILRWIADLNLMLLLVQYQGPDFPSKQTARSGHSCPQKKGMVITNGRFP